MPEAVTGLVMISLVLQGVATLLALRLIRPSGWALPWLLLAAVLMLAALRQTLILRLPGLSTPTAELLVAAVSLLAVSALGISAPFIAGTNGMRMRLDRREALVAALAEATGRLMAEETLDDLCRAAVEFARERLGTQRASIWLHAGDGVHMRGTWGTDLHGRTTDERHIVEPFSDTYRSAMQAVREPATGWRHITFNLTNLSDGTLCPSGVQAWVAGTPIHAGGDLKAVLFNDPGTSGARLDEGLQEVLVIYGALIGRLMERFEAEAVLRGSERRYRQVISLAHAVPYERDWVNGRYVFIGRDIERLIGYAADELTPALFESLVLDSQAPSDRPIRYEAPADGDYPEEARHVYGCDYRLTARDGSIRWISDVAVQLRGPNDAIRATLGMLQDITERKQLEEGLRQSQKMEALGHLAGGVAHDFNNLLTTILGYSELVLGSGGLDAAVRDDLLEVRRAAETAASLTGQLLAFSRKQLLQPRRLDLNQVISETQRMLGRLLREDIELRCELAEPLPAVVADPAQIQQVLMNLVINARDAMPHGGGLRIGTAADGDRAVLWVSDTGEGMDEPTRQRVFEPFFTTKGGTGLGLATVYGIVSQSGATIEVDSAVGVGTRFRITFPDAADAAAPVADEPRRGRLPAASGGTVLLVEDNDGVRRLAKAVLEDRGYHVIEATGPRAAELAAQANGTIDLLLTDIVMPEGSGPELAERLRGGRPELAVLFMSGHPADELERSGLTLSGLEYLPKPFGPDELADKVAVLMAKREAA